MAASTEHFFAMEVTALNKVQSYVITYVLVCMYVCVYVHRWEPYSKHIHTIHFDIVRSHIRTHVRMCAGMCDNAIMLLFHNVCCEQELGLEHVVFGGKVPYANMKKVHENKAKVSLVASTHTHTHTHTCTCAHTHTHTHTHTTHMRARTHTTHITHTLTHTHTCP